MTDPTPSAAVDADLRDRLIRWAQSKDPANIGLKTGEKWADEIVALNVGGRAADEEVKFTTSVENGRLYIHSPKAVLSDPSPEAVRIVDHMLFAAAAPRAPLPQSGDVREACAKNLTDLADALEKGGAPYNKPQIEALRERAECIRIMPLPVASPDREALGCVTWSDEHYARARDCAFDILSKDGYGLDRSKFDNAFQHAVGMLALSATPDTAPDGVREMLDKFTRHYSSWMDRHGDEVECSVYSRHTFGELRRARKLLKELGE